jgi:hypothetical protein
MVVKTPEVVITFRWIEVVRGIVTQTVTVRRY